VLRRHCSAFVSRSSSRLLDNFGISDPKVGVLFILVLLDLLVILIVETHKPVLEMLIRMNIPEMEMFLGGKDSVDCVPVRKAVTLRQRTVVVITGFKRLSCACYCRKRCFREFILLVN